ncbi:hypothetical protein C5167_005709 [Papaver somniferum]|uniref:Uncharacterized protein n=1 Tax=Papaver somniferum TaxID=3469 RepID=A0A4Y7JER4_PAPSO|nr:hypothetical protein C5167_005709 [Papaver somniferum]
MSGISTFPFSLNPEESLEEDLKTTISGAPMCFSGSAWFAQLQIYLDTASGQSGYHPSISVHIGAPVIQ